jgi:hypothetical protein
MMRNAVLRSKFPLIFVSILTALPLISMSSVAHSAPATLGWQELVRVLPGEPLLEASIDTNNEWGSLHVDSYRSIVITKAQGEAKQPLHHAPVNNTPVNNTPQSPAALTATSPTGPTPPGGSSPKASLNRKVKFSLYDRFGHSHNYELPVLRSIKVKSASGKTEIRPVRVPPA